MTRRQLMSYRARSMPGKNVTFRLDPKKNDPKNRVTGLILKAKVGDFHEVSKLDGYEILVRGTSGREVTIDSNVHFTRIHW